MEFRNRDLSLAGSRKASGGSDIQLDFEKWVEFGPVVVEGRDKILGSGKNMNKTWNQKRSEERASNSFVLEYKL